MLIKEITERYGETPFTVRELKNSLIALSNSKTKSLKKKMAVARMWKVIEYFKLEDDKEITWSELEKLPSMGKGTVGIVRGEIHLRKQ